MKRIPPHIVKFTAAPSYVRLLDTARRRTLVSRLTVTMSDGSRFRGRITVPPLLKVGFFMSTLTLSRNLTSADDGTGSWTVIATTADGQFSANLVITFTISPPVAAEGPPVFSGWPVSVQLTDNMLAGAVVASGTLTDSDGTPFNGTVNVGSAPLVFTA